MNLEGQNQPINRTTELALLADNAIEPLKLARHTFVKFDDVVERFCDLAAQTAPSDRQSHSRTSPLEIDQGSEQYRHLIPGIGHPITS